MSDQQQPVYAKFLSKQTVVASVAVRGVADDGVSEVIEVTADLMFATHQRSDDDFRISTARVFSGGEGDLPSVNCLEFRDGWLRWLVVFCLRVGHPVVLFT